MLDGTALYSDLDSRYLKLDGSNANINIDIGAYDFTTTGAITGGGAGHDQFSDFVANEHLDWTTDRGATNIHSGNIPIVLWDSDGEPSIDLEDRDLLDSEGDSILNWETDGEANFSNNDIITIRDVLARDLILSRDATIGGDILTDAPNVNDIGDATNYWKNLYANQVIINAGFSKIGDPTTFFAFALGGYYFYTVGQEMLRMLGIIGHQGAQVLFNDGIDDVDFRISGNTQDNLFNLDAGLDVIWMGDGGVTNYTEINAIGDIIQHGSASITTASRISSGTTTITASSDVTDVSGVNTVFINITGDIVLGGLVGGVDGQVVNFAIIGNFTNHCRFEHIEGIGGSQDFINHTSLDEDIDHGGCVYVCNGTNWYDVSHARHV